MIRLTPGALRHRWKQAFGHGFRTAYLRDVVRRRILRAPPIAGTTDLRCELHVMTSGNDWLNLCWALYSFYRQSGRNYSLAIHDDGTVPLKGRFAMRRLFPDSHYVERRAADRLVLDALSGFPRCQEFRRTNHLAPKLFDFAHFLRSDRMLLLDSDVLFFACPAELLRRIEDPAYRLNAVNRDVATAYTVKPQEASRELGFAVVERFNSGLGLIHKDSLRPDWIERFLELPGIVGHFWQIEQTLFALCSSKFGCELLPEGYDVRLEGSSDGLPCRHYVGRIRHQLYREGLAKLVKARLLG